ncbi:MAG: 4-hydroxy-3-methylbut-2-enyl diphosphate reductase, partial [Clostridia bacterium]|nr:4-hydroxy-3-methylbut-2-enyl diphosphate reductase [Clostridia bacterium]
MKITLAKTAGFCFGVDRAVNMVYELLNNNKKVCTLGPIIHNPQLVDELKGRGVKIVESPNQVLNDEVLVIRSHGVPESVLKEAENCACQVADATCPFVAKIHKIVDTASKNGHIILVAGDSLHHEVIGILGHINGQCYVFSDEKELENLLKKHNNFADFAVTVVSQTTFNKKTFEKCCKILKKVCTNAAIFDTICNATALRQQEAECLAKVNDVMIVIGGKHSSNTAKLYEVCLANCKNTFLIETAQELNGSFFKNA